MTTPPDHPKLYHITHVENLERILAAGGLVCDRDVLARGGPVHAIGMSTIKRRRVEELGVQCHPGTKVGDYVPFYFCPRSVMLFVIHCANNPELTYRDGQEPIVHLEADLHAVVRWANAQEVRWAFSLSNAGARHAQFRSRSDELDQLDWLSISATDFSGRDVKEHKQAEFLVHARFPFALVERIGVRSLAIRKAASAVLPDRGSRPAIEVRPEWYFRA